jgi:hypothetical protein
MPCACNEGAQAPQVPEKQYRVRYPDGRVEFVTGEHAAKVAATMGGPGTTYSVQ